VSELESIARTRAVFSDAVRSGDGTAASAVYTADARLLPPAATSLAGRAAIASYWQAGVETGLSEAAFESSELHRFDAVAYEIGRYTLRLTAEDGGAVVDCGDYLIVHERQADGSWLWAVEMFNPDVPAARPEEGSRS
jgi:ketosteroid isomerase-like protein